MPRAKFEAELQALLVRLDRDETRRDAARELVVWGEVLGLRPELEARLPRLLGDADRAVQTDVARALVAMGGRQNRAAFAVLGHAIGGADAALRERALEVLPEAVRAPGQADALVAPIAVALADGGDDAAVAAAAPLLARGGAPAATLRRLLAHPAPSVRRVAVEALADDPQTRAEAVAAAHGLFDDEPLAAVGLVVEDALARGDAAGLSALATQRSLAVREALGHHVAAAARRGVPVQAAVPALVALVSGENARLGGPLFEGMQALLAAGEAGCDVSAAAQAAAALVGEDRYPDDGWASGRDLVSESDRHGWSLGADARRLLTLARR